MLGKADAVSQFIRCPALVHAVKRLCQHVFQRIPVIFKRRLHLRASNHGSGVAGKQILGPVLPHLIQGIDPAADIPVLAAADGV